MDDRIQTVCFQLGFKLGKDIQDGIVHLDNSQLSHVAEAAALLVKVAQMSSRPDRHTWLETCDAMVDERDIAQARVFVEAMHMLGIRFELPVDLFGVQPDSLAAKIGQLLAEHRV